MERVYPKDAWVTPSELFKPFYGYTIGSYMFTHSIDCNLRSIDVVEIGPGTGTFADSLLSYFKNYSLEQYSKINYSLVEISPELA